MCLSSRALFAIIPLLSLTASAAADARTLLPHRAVYDLALADTNDESDIQQLTGRWVFEFSGTSCEGYTLQSRIVMRFEMTEGTSVIDQRVMSFEDAEGDTFRFVTRSFIDQELENEVRGTARREPSGTLIEYQRPERKKVSLAPVLFPTAQLRELLDKAEAGERFYESAIFDGTEYAEAPVLVSVVVGQPAPVAESDPEKAVLGALASAEFRPVTAAYFDGKEAGEGEETSDYNVSFKLHESGIQRDMVIRYRDYSMTARLTNLALFEPDEECSVEDAR
ncbi:cell envelope integrity EipB family protein [Chelativorans sp. Marseille-P2723]|uniref:cell envelope integrity EipB family protein n=1 Tax=Chelativorans sp. Marseille-P2723 TaxID=2709133 RepID=UPI00156DC286|nr:cell envelope integrity EipB family protein [Chelativorans sp. Marseille-P2723]